MILDTKFDPEEKQVVREILIGAAGGLVVALFFLLVRRLDK